MRLSSLQTFITGTNQIVSLSGQVNTTQEQISRGTRILNPSDDPVASSQILKLNQENALREQYQDNITLLESRLELEEATLGAINNTLIRVRELVIQANNGGLTITDRQAIQAELEVRQDELADLMNTRDSSNEYLFAGFRGNTEPFVDNGIGNFSYTGDEGQRLLQVAASTFVPANDSGKTIFVDVESAEPTFRTQANPVNRANPAATISSGFVADQEAFNNIFPEDYIIEFQHPDDLALLGQPPGFNYNIIQKSDGRVVESNIAYQSGEPIEFNGMEFTISGSPSVGDSFIINSSDNQDILTTVSRVIEGMQNLTLSAEDEDAYQALMATTIENLDNAQTSVLETRAEIGARLNTLDSTRKLHEEVDVISVQLLSSLQDLDYAEAVSQLSFESFVLQAAQESYARIAGLSLFNSL
ncbi:flagellar hook-associated protein FlgL [Maricurvus nonylphenolicus]|uniref:flagellar hook-associated protein FlgL n=1 Tax=Maricurvus nonylphenolicus TaxID=1008307 RepID=UPI0036F34EB6